ncbi:hypothetical protein DDE18_16070 [Nocardioides gansuensis]|uniref:Uncharacterized protein n=1 Tax=Nocardioides gansuensis TaxID=2138300 RepID=A0A2T8F744_9ACTN|nr:PilN domain-containing protein [Nocardioides gansuensis]PVG81530.1 hypothetical protein DDE18_16070 [Nocardioides gansuensis]
MSRARARRREAPTPTVNLLSQWSFEALATRRLRLRFVVGAVVLAALLTAGWGLQHLRAGQAGQLLSIAEAERATLASKTAQLAPVRTFVTAVEKRKQTVTEAMGDEVRFSRVLSELSMATPADAALTNIAVTLTPPTPAAPAGETGAAAAEAPSTGAVASACPGPDPFGTRPVVGCLTLSGTAASRDAVGQLVVDLGRSGIFVEPFISTTTTADGPRVSFTGTVGLSPSAFTGRYHDLDTLLHERNER